MDDRTQFYLNNGWLTPRMASIAGMYEDGEGIREELERLDESLVHLGHIAWDAWAALDHDRWEELAGDLFDILKKLELKAQEGEPVLF